MAAYKLVLSIKQAFKQNKWNIFMANSISEKSGPQEKQLQLPDSAPNQSRKSKMVASNPEILIPQSSNEIETEFQQQNLYF